MESSSICRKSVSEGENSPKSCPIHRLSNDLSDKLEINGGSTMNNVNDAQKRPVVGYYIEEYEEEGEEEEEEEKEEDDLSEEELLAQMGYGKLEPKREIKKEHQKQYYDDEEEEEEGDNLSEESLLAQMGCLKKEPPKYEPITTPTAALNLVSALKGSRDKEGKPTRECRISWAPDVYDPPPSSAEHFATTNTERHKSEHKVKGAARKNRQKTVGEGAGVEIGVGGGKGSKGGGNKGTGGRRKVGVKDKDKKQVKKHVGSASKYSYFDD